MLEFGNVEIFTTGRPSIQDCGQHQGQLFGIFETVGTLEVHVLLVISEAQKGCKSGQESFGYKGKIANGREPWTPADGRIYVGCNT